MDTNSEWLKYFEQNAKEILPVNHDEYRLTDEEWSRIEKSIQAFEIGEASEGKCLKQKAAEYALKAGEPLYPEIMKYFIREENRHSAYLSKFMHLHGIAKKKSNWTDGVFRFLRNLFNLEVSIRVLVAAELIAIFYYRALGEATGSSLLKTICARMLAEEREHVKFQMLTIHKINLPKHPIAAALSDMLHGLLVCATIGVVWHEHKAVLARAYSFGSFYSAVYDAFRECMDDGRERAFRALIAERFAEARRSSVYSSAGAGS
ncbi:MAG TPA: hypothetical protein VFV50_08460 [Bdellovibrionales bacterium]|nr:hypothetical protein [Bdellovibrionales bacterium]